MAAISSACSSGSCRSCAAWEGRQRRAGGAQRGKPADGRRPALTYSEQDVVFDGGQHGRGVKSALFVARHVVHRVRLRGGVVGLAYGAALAAGGAGTGQGRLLLFAGRRAARRQRLGGVHRRRGGSAHAVAHHGGERRRARLQGRGGSARRTEHARARRAQQQRAHPAPASARGSGSGGRRTGPTVRRPAEGVRPPAGGSAGGESPQDLSRRVAGRASGRRNAPRAMASIALNVRLPIPPNPEAPHLTRFQSEDPPLWAASTLLDIPASPFDTVAQLKARIAGALRRSSTLQCRCARGRRCSASSARRRERCSSRRDVRLSPRRCRLQRPARDAARCSQPAAAHDSLRLLRRRAHGRRAAAVAAQGRRRGQRRHPRGRQNAGGLRPGLHDGHV